MQIGLNSLDGGAREKETSGIALVKIDAFGCLQDVLHAKLIGFLIALGARGADAWTLASVEKAPLNSGGIGIKTHCASQGIDFANHVALAQPANRGVATHLADRVEILGQDCDLATETGGSQRCLDPGVASANNEDVVFFRITEHIRL